MRKKLLSLLLLFVMSISLIACGSKDTDNEPTGGNETQSDDKQTDDKQSDDSSLQYIVDNGKLILGLDDAFPPMGFRDDSDNIVGFDIDLAKAVCEKLGVELVLQPIEWDAKEQELNTKNIDCIWNGFSVTPERKENLTMTKPYLENNISLVVVKGSAIATMADMAGKKLAVQSGSSAEESLNADTAKDFKASLGEINGFGDYVTALMDLETGNSDAVLMDSVVANYMITDAGKDFVVLDETLVADEYAIGFRKGELALANAVENALAELKVEGKIAEISTKWFGSDITLIK